MRVLNYNLNGFITQRKLYILSKSLQDKTTLMHQRNHTHITQRSYHTSFQMMQTLFQHSHNHKPIMPKFKFIPPYQNYHNICEAFQLTCMYVYSVRFRWFGPYVIQTRLDLKRQPENTPTTKTPNCKDCIATIFVNEHRWRRALVGFIMILDLRDQASATLQLTSRLQPT